jgi:hypothetical protein
MEMTFAMWNNQLTLDDHGKGMLEICRRLGLLLGRFNALETTLAFK